MGTLFFSPKFPISPPPPTPLSYGATGSGKTHTVLGSTAEPGVLPRAIITLYDIVASSPGGGGAGRNLFLSSGFCLVLALVVFVIACFFFVFLFVVSDYSVRDL